MKILVATYQFRINEIFSLKDKRSIIKKLINGLKKKYNIAISESGFNDHKKIGEITVVTLSNDVDFLLNLYETIENNIEYSYGLNIIRSNYEIL